MRKVLVKLECELWVIDPTDEAEVAEELQERLGDGVYEIKSIVEVGQEAQ